MKAEPVPPRTDAARAIDKHVPSTRLGPVPGGVLRGVGDAIPLALAGLGANGANVVVTVVVARLLASRGYGALNQLTGVFLVVSLPGLAVPVAVVRGVAAFGPSVSADTVRAWAQRLDRLGMRVLAGFTVVALACGWPLSGALGRRHPWALDLVLVAGAVWVLLSLDRGLLQARRRYRALSANLLVEGGLRTALVLGFVGAGLGVTGAAAGILVAEVGTAVHARVLARRVWGGSQRDTVPAAPAPLRGARGHSRQAAHDLAWALVALAMIALLQNADVIVMGREGPTVDGAYAAVSVACKALVFGALVLGAYLLPEAAIRWRRGTHALAQLGAALVILAVPATVLVVVAAAAPTALLRVVFSGNYVGAAGAFLPLALAMVALALTVVCTTYLLAIGDRIAAVVLSVGAGVLVGVAAAAGGNPVTTARADLAVQAIVLVAVVGAVVRVHRRRSVASR